MNDFAKKVSEIIKSKKLAVYSVAKNCNIERTYLSRVLSGERKLTYDKLNSLLSFLNLSPSEETEMRGLYIEDVFGKERYEKYLDFIEKLGRFDSTEDVYQLNPSIRINLDLGNDFLSFNGALDTANVIDFAVGNEFTKEGVRTRFYTNIPSDKIFILIRKYVDDIPETMDFRHMISVSKDDIYTLDAVFDIVKNMRYSRYTMYYTTDSSCFSTPDTLFPYYVITDDLCIFINGSFDSCHTVKNKPLADIQAQEFLKKSKNARNYITVFDDILSCKDSCMQIHSAGYDTMYSFGSFCSALYMTADMWEQIAREEIPSRDYLIKSTYEYYHNFLKIYKHKTHVFFKNSIDDFIDNGLTISIPKEYIVPLTPKNRLKVLENFRKEIVSSNQKFIIIKDVFAERLKNIAVDVFAKSNDENAKFLSFYTITESAPMHYVGNINCCIDESKTIDQFLQFARYFTVSGVCYTPEESLAILDDAIERCKAMKS